MTRKRWPAHALRVDEPDALVGIQDPAITMALWDRKLPPALAQEALSLPINAYPNVRIITDRPDEDVRNAFAQHAIRTGLPVPELVLTDVVAQVELFRRVTGVQRILVRIERTTERHIRFLHVDGAVVRLLTTYRGRSTKWLANEDVRREGLNKCDDELVYWSPFAVRRMLAGQVAFMKGELWPGNAGNGLVHGEPRILLPEHWRWSLVIDDARNVPTDPEQLSRFLTHRP